MMVRLLCQTHHDLQLTLIDQETIDDGTSMEINPSIAYL